MIRITNEWVSRFARECKMHAATLQIPRTHPSTSSGQAFEAAAKRKAVTSVVRPGTIDIAIGRAAVLSRRQGFGLLRLQQRRLRLDRVSPSLAPNNRLQTRYNWSISYRYAHFGQPKAGS